MGLLKKIKAKTRVLFALSMIFTLMFSMNAYATQYGTADLERDSYFYAPGEHWIRMIANIHVNYAYDEGVTGWIVRSNDNYVTGEILSESAVIDETATIDYYYTDSTYKEVVRVNYIDGFDNYTVDIHVGAGCDEWGNLSTYSDMYDAARF